MSLIRPCLDLTRNAWTQRHGDITVYGTWYWDEDDRQWVPSLVLLRNTTLILIGRTVPVVIPVDHVWWWSEEQGSYADCLPSTMAYVEALGLPPDQHSIFRVIDLIRDHIEDAVKRIPPRPKDDDELKVMADASAVVDGKTLHRMEIKDRV